MTRRLALSIVLAIAAGCSSGVPDPIPLCMSEGDALRLVCSATATFCASGPPDSTGACPGGPDDEVVVTGFEPAPGVSRTCTGCVTHTGDREDPADTCDRRMCWLCRQPFASRRCLACTASVVSVGPDACPLPDFHPPGGGIAGGSGVDAGPPDAAPGPTSAFLVRTFPYGGGTRILEPIVTELDSALGTPTAIAADELLWVGFADGMLRGLDLETGSVDVELDLSSFARGMSPSVNRIEVYEDPLGARMAVVALGAGVARIEITGDRFIDRGFAPTGNTRDARIHRLPALMDEGYVVASSTATDQLWVIPRIADTGRFPPRSRPMPGASTGARRVTPEAIADGFVWTAERDRLGTFCTTPCVTEGDDPDLPSRALLPLTDEILRGLGGPDFVVTVASELYVGRSLLTAGFVASHDPATLAELDRSPFFDGPLSAFGAVGIGRDIEGDVYVFATNAASGRGDAELLVMLPSSPIVRLAPITRATLEPSEAVLDLAFGVQPRFSPPAKLMPGENPMDMVLRWDPSTAAIHLLINRRASP